ncbi:crotonobetaine/carnitine-CoA ligase [Pseudonocardia thermophila]|uniref:Crotonobetaine/carnitine-CoA ligase n=1 Tax=Pseudonocardia thermophila TaxID=1848 RepID=A0A1M6WR44_PSETH|nr:AMP-binding protein [Pseudonocardia thermophila]SHK95995.1 crotonobetaine/carnitine-CoA ligase [Pseudonocardia thermophila]
MTAPGSSSWDSRPIQDASYDYVTIPAARRTINALWQRALAAHPDRPFISFDGGSVLTYRQVEERAGRWRACLRRAGIRPGELIAVMLPNSLDTMALWVAVLSEGAVIVPINPDFRGAILQHLLTDSGAVLLVAAPDGLANVEADWELPALREIVLATGTGLHDRLTVSTFDATAPPVPARPDAAKPGDVAAVLYTSGTTGVSKGVVIPHEHLFFYGWSYAHAMRHHHEDVLFTPLPMFHANAMCVTIFPAIFVGARVTVRSRFSAGQFWHQIADSGATHFAGMGTVGNILMKRPPSEFRPDHRLRHCHLVPAPEQLAEFEERFRVPVYYSTYGLTEGQVVLQSRDGSRRPGLIGKNHPYHDVRVVADDGSDAPVDGVGELVVRPRLANLMFREYLGRPEATAQAWRDGWFHTGDLVSRDADGNLWFRGRAKDVIRRRGENISAFEVERELMEHPAVGEVAAVGVPSDLGEEEVLAVVVPRIGTELDLRELAEWARRKLPGYMAPRYWRKAAELPKNSSHKVLKNALRDQGVDEHTLDLQASAPAAGGQPR